MKQNSHIKTGIASLTFYAVVAMASVNSFGTAQAMEYTAAPLTSKQAVTASPVNSSQSVLNFDRKNFMKESYRDVKFDLIGPLKFSIDDDYVERRFTHAETSRAERVRSPYETSPLSTSTYYKATVAKTGFKVKF